MNTSDQEKEPKTSQQEIKSNRILVRYGELTLKQGNRKEFVRQLKKNVQYALSSFNDIYIQATRDRMYIKFEVLSSEDIENMINRLSGIPGIQSVSPCLKIDLEEENTLTSHIQAIARSIDYPNTTFKVSVKRALKSYTMDTFEMQSHYGGVALNATEHLTVNVKSPDETIYIEVRKDGFFVYQKIIQGAGGLPVGSAGKTLLMLSGGIDSPVAGIEIMRRGVTTEAIHFFSPPFTSEDSKQKVIDLCHELSKITGEYTMYIVYFTNVQKAILKEIPDNISMTITRRMMLRLAEQLSDQIGVKAIVNGENLGQVASQTLDSMYAINDVTSMPILRPLLTMDKDEIIERAKKHNTFDISTRPFEDCCTVFAPKSPKTKPKLEAVQKFEEKLNIEQLIVESFNKTEVVSIKAGTVNVSQLNEQKDESSIDENVEGLKNKKNSFEELF